MNDAVLVRGGKPGAHLAGNLEGLVRWQVPDAAQQGGQVFAVHVLHGEELQAVGFADIEDAADVGMGNLAGDADFAVEARHGRAILGDGFRQEFQRHRLAELEVFGAIDFAHGAASGHGHDAVAVLKDGARSKSRAIEGAGGRGNPATRRGVPLARRSPGRTGGSAERLQSPAWAWSREPLLCRRKGKSAPRQGLHFRRQSRSWMTRKYITARFLTPTLESDHSRETGLGSSVPTYRERWGQFASSIRESGGLITMGLIWPYRFHR